jgi:hypothetical protein
MSFEGVKRDFTPEEAALVETLVEAKEAEEAVERAKAARDQVSSARKDVVSFEK